MYALGHLITETPHPETSELSDLAQKNLSQGIKLLLKIDTAAWQKMGTFFESLEQLRDQVVKTIQNQNRVFLCGCGATGRLSLSLDWMNKALRPNPDLAADATVSFMAGGDVALVSALEGFEDYPELGASHAQLMNFGPQDLLIASTEGGETPYVIGATKFAAEHSHRPPWFLYCNPREMLVQTVQRSREILTHSHIQNICLNVGPMPLAGSTRMQTSSVLMAGIGLALFEHPRNWEKQIQELIKFESEMMIPDLETLILRESETYLQGNHSLYLVDPLLAITVFTDTTERAPTFSLNSFDHPDFPQSPHSLSYVSIRGTSDSSAAWRSLLGRAPVCLERTDLSPKSTYSYLQGFDFSEKAQVYRRYLIQKDPTEIRVSIRKDTWNLQIDSAILNLPLQESLLMNHLLLKSVLNIHSTLVMGRLGRYTGNLMTYVKPTNGKLIDRAIRYVDYLLKRKGKVVSYNQIHKKLLEVLPNIKANESVVIKVFDLLNKGH